MKFNTYFKEKEKWINRIIEPPANSNQDFFRALKMRIINELEIIRETIKNLSNYNCRVPRAKEEKNQKWLNNLVKMRKANTFVYEQLKMILIKDDCIVCPNCGELMMRIPLNVPINKLGETYILSLNVNNGGIIYHYQCPNCVQSISENLYNQMINLKEERKKLIEKGIYFVPNCAGVYNWIKGKPTTGRKYLYPEPIEK